MMLMEMVLFPANDLRKSLATVGQPMSDYDIRVMIQVLKSNFFCFVWGEGEGKERGRRGGC